MLAFTSDIDWAPESVIKEMLDIFEEYQVKCTLFCTHDSEVIRKCNKELFEIAIHPNFNPLLEGKGGNVNKIVSDLLSTYPEAKGVRSHSLTQNSTILQKFAQKGLLYEANHFSPYINNIEPFWLWSGMLRIPYNWEDDVHWLYNKTFDKLGIEISENGFQVLDFHPIHIFLNTDCQETYDIAKKFYHSPEDLIKFKNTTKKGTYDLLIKTLVDVRNRKIKSYKMIEVFNLFKR